MKKFDIPDFYKSSIIGNLKNKRKLEDPRKKDFTPSVLEYGNVSFYIARHFGFCYGVENAIEIAYRAINDNPEKNIFLLSEMIHNPGVNEDLLSRGARFLMDTEGNFLPEWDEITSNDIVIIPAFGTTVEIEEKLKEKGIDPYRYNTTCPFVEKVWNRSTNLGKKDYTIIIHGKYYHEETRATFSHIANDAPSIILRDIKETEILCDFILDKIPESVVRDFFKGKFSENFDFKTSLQRIGVVNQTTMIAEETEAIADMLKDTIIKKFGEENIKNHFADTKDTLCYATNDNQESVRALLNEDIDFAFVIGGYNSSNTNNLAELLSSKHTVYYIESAEDLISDTRIRNYDFAIKDVKFIENYIPVKDKLKVGVTSGASCPDAVVDEVLMKFLSLLNN